MKIEEPRPEDAPSDRTYVTPVLRVFGPVAVLTGTVNMAGTQMDGGPNNTKT
jgi:hypothetical protein